MKWITYKLMKYQLNIVKKRQAKYDCGIVKMAYDDCIKSYKSAILFLS